MIRIQIKFGQFNNKFTMLKKVKYIIKITVASLIILAIIFIIVSLDKLDFQYYGLNYNYITATFAVQIVYEPGLYLIGFSNQLLEVPKIFQQINFVKLQTYTNDYFPLTISAEVSYRLLVPNNTADGNQKFTFLKDFYILFGSRAEQEALLTPIIRNEIIKMASNYSSQNYRDQSIFVSLQSKIKSSLAVVVSRWTSFQFSVLISSIVSEGISYNKEPIDRKISSLVAQAQRIQAQKVQMTDYIKSVERKTKIQMQIIQSIISNYASANEMLVQSANPTTTNINQLLLVLDQTRKNLSYASSQLSLRPQLYLINNTILY